MSIQNSRPPATEVLHPVELLGSLVLRNDPASVPLARRFADVALMAGGYDDCADVFEVVVSELVTNAVVHNQGISASPIHLRMVRRGTTVRLEVHDEGECKPVVRRVRSGDESGRGLHIVEALTTRWGTYRTNTDKCVWCELDISAVPEVWS
ncbi:ATP-binding protein [Streptomyces sp. RB6PN25]|uniref:ATP-binding protein n=1 Tax=Streptomyces humicola TaxID=2953240 RepID=A0ABT1PTZ0_9ACTN|nr:ATP-binding protein [Streptomyces humicola]MCQ4081132.1 ATP-binding protein [Streptomyces humicola]